MFLYVPYPLCCILLTDVNSVCNKFNEMIFLVSETTGKLRLSTVLQLSDKEFLRLLRVQNQRSLT